MALFCSASAALLPPFHVEHDFHEIHKKDNCLGFSPRAAVRANKPLTESGSCQGTLHCVPGAPRNTGRQLRHFTLTPQTSVQKAVLVYCALGAGRERAARKATKNGVTQEPATRAGQGRRTGPSQGLNSQKGGDDRTILPHLQPRPRKAHWDGLRARLRFLFPFFRLYLALSD